jgi:DNA-binding GntR family transcriptional regulator
MRDARQTACTIIEQRIVRGDLAEGRRIDERSLASELHTDPGVVREALVRLERDNLTRAEDDGGFSVAPLDELELRELYPVVLLLEGLAVRSAPHFLPERLAALRAINARMRAAADDAIEAATADWEFHDELVRGCGNDQLLDTLRPLKRQLLRYEFAYMDERAAVEGSVAQHAGIVDALERDDRDAAAALVEANYRDALPGLLARLDAAARTA